ncbi:MAG: hypothetical protein AAB347_08280 [Bacteroidota bacterium]
MLSNIEKYKKDIQKLIKSGESIVSKMKENKNLAQLRQDYEIWYSESYAVIKIILPDRIIDFAKMYYDDKTKSGIKIRFQYTPPDSEGINWGMDSYSPPKEIDIAKSIFDSQIGILKSCEKRFESSLFDIKQLLQADIFDSELDAARELNKKGFARGAGAMAGVVLEGHLSQVCWNHKIAIKKNHPTINDFNQLLKDNEVIETTTWRFIQNLADLRNLCDHKKQQEPTKEQIEELIDGVVKINKTLY